MTVTPVKELSSLQAEFVLARILGYHARMKHVPYVTIDDWDKEGSLVSSERFEPIMDGFLCEKIRALDNIQTLGIDGDWSAGYPNIEVRIGCYFGARSRNEAIVRCKVQYAYPNGVPANMLEDHPLPQAACV